MRHWITLLAFATACTSFESIDRGVCGNGLLEAGEDCDSDAATCVQCAVTCTVAADCPTADHACGVDGTCYAPGGALGQPIATGPFQVNDYRITDVDHDGTGDVLGLSTTSIGVRYGDPTGALTRSSSLITPAQTGAPSLADLDRDGSIDLTFGTADGLLGYTSAFGTLAPINAPTSIAGDGDFRTVFSIAPTVLGGVITDPMGRLLVISYDFVAPDQRSTLEAPCNRLVPTEDFDPANLEVYRVDTGGTAIDLVVAMVLGRGANARLCVMSIHKEPLLAARFDDITPMPVPVLATRPVLADIEGDADLCPGLISSDAGPSALRYWDGAMTAGHCGLAATGANLPALVGAAPDAVAIGHLPLDPPIFLVGRDGLVLSDGLYGYVPLNQTFYQVYPSARRLGSVVTADLDRDGDTDAVLVPELEDDLDVLFRESTPEGYQLLRLDTASRITRATLEDFDGNGIVDIGYVEELGSHQRLMMAYGTPDRPLPAVEVGAFGNLRSLAAVAFPATVDLLSLATDLVVLEARPSGGATITLLIGSPQRTMVPYFDPRLQPALDATPAIRSVSTGRFTPQTSNVADLFMLATPAVGTAEVRAWRIAGTPNGPDGTPSSGAPVTGLEVAIADAMFMTWPFDATRDVVFAIDRASPPHAARIDAWSDAATLAATPLAALTAQVPPGTAVRALHRADLDGDGADELIAVFAPTASPATGGILVCQVAGAMPTACVDLAVELRAQVPEVAACIDAAPGRIAYRDRMLETAAGDALAVLCRDPDGGSLLLRVEGIVSPVITPLARTARNLRGLRVGDVTGDGVPDVVALEGDAGARSLLVFAQCTSRNLASCQRGTGP